MGRKTSVLVGLLSALMPLALAQEPHSKTPEDVLAARELIAWSYLQKPQPAPQPLPPRDTPIPEHDESQDHARTPADPQTQPEPVQSFTGKILRQDGKFVLRTESGTAYLLYAQGDLQKYEDQRVKVTGDLDARSNTIRVVNIVLLS